MLHEESGCSDSESASNESQTMGESTEDDQMNSESDEGEWEEMEIGKSPGPNRDGTPDHEDPLCSYYHW